MSGLKIFQQRGISILTTIKKTIKILKVNTPFTLTTKT